MTATAEDLQHIAKRARPAVAAFARLMETELRANDAKGGWHECKPKWLLARACEELAELVETVKPTGPGPHEPVRNALFLARHHLVLASQCLNGIGAHAGLQIADSTGSEAADTANFLMMFLDVLDRLPNKESEGAGAARR